MRIRVLFFARARELAGKEHLELAIEDGDSLRHVVSALSESLPQLGAYLPSCRFAVNEEFSGLDDRVPDGAEVAVIPPVSGGVSRRLRHGG